MEKQHDTTTLYQHGTLGLLVPGLFDGTQSVGDLLMHGDFGIGTASGIDGEMVILAGVPYLVKADGSVSVVDDATTTPFANVHFDQPTASFSVNHVTMADLGKTILANADLQNVFFAVKIEGKFTSVKTRAVAKQQKPYPPLAAVAKSQSIFEKDDVCGTVIGYFSPEMYAGMAAPGYHLHFLDDAHTMGGHLLNFTIADACVYLQPFANVNLHLPTDNPEFMAQSFDLTTLNDEIRGAESE